MSASPPRYTEAHIDLAEIVDWASFHAVFQKKLGFLEGYGANMDAWIDCMTCVDAPEDGMSTVHAPREGVLVLVLESVADFRKRCPRIFDELLDCSAVVNHRRMEMGDPPVLSLSYRA